MILPRSSPTLVPSPNHRLFRRPRLLAPRGLTLVEAIMLITVMSIVAVGVAVGLQSASDVPVRSDQTGAISAELTSEMENWRAVAWGGSPWPSSFPSNTNDTVALHIHGRTITCTRTTSIQNWDPNNISANAAPQSDFVRIQITINAQVLTAYLTRPL